jgi:hypothetical protein
MWREQTLVELSPLRLAAQLATPSSSTMNPRFMADARLPGTYYPHGTPAQALLRSLLMVGQTAGQFHARTI